MKNKSIIAPGRLGLTMLRSALAMALGVITLSLSSQADTITSANGHPWDIDNSSGVCVDGGSDAFDGYGSINISGSDVSGLGLVLSVRTHATSTPVTIGGVQVTRRLDQPAGTNYLRYFDTFTNTTSSPITVPVAWGGNLGSDSSTVLLEDATGDNSLTDADSWALTGEGTGIIDPIVGYAVGLGGPSRSVLDSPSGSPYPSSGVGYLHWVYQLTLAPGQSASLVHFLYRGWVADVVNPDGVTPTAAQAIADARAAVVALTSNPDFSGLSPTEQNLIVNWDGAGGGGLGRILLIEDQGGFGTASDVLTANGFDVTVVNNEFANAYATLLNTAYLSQFSFVVYGERGSGSGDVMPEAVRASLEAYIQAGGNLLVTGYDTLASPTDAALASLVRVVSPGDLVSGNTTWAVSATNHPIINGPFGDVRGQTFTATGYDDDLLTPDTAAGAVELVSTGSPRVTGKLIFTDLPGGAGSVGYWNGGVSGNSNDAQPDFSDGGNPQAIFLNYASFAAGSGGGGTLFFDDFDPDYDAALWESFGGTVAANTNGQAAGAGSTANSLWFGGDGSRFATTIPLNTQTGGDVSFLFALGSGGAFPWEDADLVEEQVVLEYSLDGVNFVQMGGPYSNRTWQQIVQPIPAAAQSAATRFRFRQLSNSGASYDHWAIDDVSINGIGGSWTPPVITSPLTASATTGAAFSYTIQASNSPTSFGASGLPSGLSVNSTTGVISGTVAAAGVYPITISATNAGGTGNATLTLTVSGGGSGGGNVLVVGAPSDSAWNDEVAAKISALAAFNQVDVFDAKTATPTLAQLNAYDAVLVYSDAAFSDAVLLGDRLADYVDAGGGLVIASFATGSPADQNPLQGRLVSGGYLPYVPGEIGVGIPLTLVADLPGHPLLAGVASFSGGPSSYHDNILLAAGATQVAQWSNGVPLVMFKQTSTRPVVALNFYPPSSDSRSDFWDVSTDGAILMRNALQMAGGSGSGGLDFQILSLGSTGSAVVDHDALTNDDRGGIAVSGNRVFVTGDGATSSHALNDLSGGVSLGAIYDGLCSDIGTGKVYTFAFDGTPFLNGTTTQINQLIELDPATGSLTGNVTPLTLTITPNAGSANGVFSGKGRVVIHNGSNVFDILIPSGVVADLGVMSLPSWAGSESWAVWGVAEYFGGDLHLAYRSALGQYFERARVPDGQTQTISTFTDLGDLTSWTVSPATGRWYFHYENGAQFGGSFETLGYADATFSTGSGTLPPVITSPLTASATIGAAFSYTIQASNSPTSFGASGLPSGLSVNSTTGVISGTVAAAGVYPITISATNAGGTGNATLTLTVTGGGGGSTVFFDDFDPDYDAALWESFGGTVAANTYGQAAGAGSTANSLWFGGDGSRFATTIPLNTQTGGDVSFLFALGNGGAFPWEDADLVEEQVVLEYSLDGVNFVQMGGPYSNRTWQQIVEPIPAAAQSAATRFRFRQMSNSGASYDHWAIDDVSITGSAFSGVVALFSNSSHVDTSREVPNTSTSLTNLGLTVTPFTGTDAASWNAAFAGAGAVVIPELEVASLNLAPDVIAVIQNQLAAGKGLVVLGDGSGNAPQLLNAINGWSLSSSDYLISGSIAKASGVAGFPNSPDPLTAQNAIYLLSPASLPAGAQTAYQTTSGVAVFTSGRVAYLGYDWYDGPTTGWDAVLSDALQAVGGGGSINRAPTFAGYAVSTSYETAVTISLFKLLAKASDADGDTLSVSSAGPASAQGGTAVLQSGSILYTPPAAYSGSDSFTVTIADAHGATVVGTITITVGTGPSAGGQGGNVPRLTLLPGGHVGIAFQGIPGRPYQIQRSTDLTNWTTIATVDAAPNGAVIFTDETPPPGSGFYRLKKP